MSFFGAFFSVTALGQTEGSASIISLIISNGISNSIFVGRSEKPDYNIAYINAIDGFFIADRFISNVGTCTVALLSV